MNGENHLEKPVEPGVKLKMPYTPELCNEALRVGMNLDSINNDLQCVSERRKEDDVDSLKRILVSMIGKEEVREVLKIGSKKMDRCKIDELYNEFLKRGLSPSDFKYNNRNNSPFIHHYLTVRLPHFSVTIEKIFKYDNNNEVEIQTYPFIVLESFHNTVPFFYPAKTVVSLLLWADAVYDDFRIQAKEKMMEYQRWKAVCNLKFSAAEARIAEVMEDVQCDYCTERHEDMITLYVNLPDDHEAMFQFKLTELPDYDRLKYYLQNLIDMYKDYGSSIYIHNENNNFRVRHPKK